MVNCMRDDDLAIFPGVLFNYLGSFKDPIRPREVCRTWANPTHPIFQLLTRLWLYADRCVYTAELLSSAYQWSSSPPPLTLGIHRDAGLAGRAAVSIISVTCPARQPAALPAIRLGFILGLKNTGLNLAFGRSPSLSVSWQTAALVPRCHSVKAKAGRACL